VPAGKASGETPAYNPRIPAMSERFSRVSACILILLAAAAAADWSQPARALADKVRAQTGPAAVAISFKNSSSMSATEMSEARRAIEQALRAAGLRFVPPDQAKALVNVTFSENAVGSLWIAQVRPPEGAESVAMVEAARSSAAGAARSSTRVIIRKQLLWLQEQRILDAAVLDPTSAAARLLVLAPERVLVLRRDAGRWLPEQELVITHARPWPRDLRGRLQPRRDRLFDAYLPGVLCSSSAQAPITMPCRASDEPWPLTVAEQPPQYAAFAPARNHFTGSIRPGFGELRSTAPFFAAAGLPRENHTLWLFTGLDGALRVTDGASERVIGPRGWGSDVAAVLSGCGGAQAVISGAGDSLAPDSVVALDVPEREPVAVSQPLEFSGPVTALWSAHDGGGAIAVSKNLKTGLHEAYALTLACAQ